MGVIGILLLVFFVIITVLLVLMVLVQSEDGDSLGGLFAGGSNSAFGSRSGNILTKTTSVLGALFLVGSFALALVNRTPGSVSIDSVEQEIEAAGATDWVDSSLEAEGALDAADESEDAQ